MSEIKTAKYEIISNKRGNQYKFFDDLSGALVVETKPIKAETPEKELAIAWEKYGRKHFNQCRSCGKYVTELMYNADVCNCVKCTAWEMKPHYCSVCGVKVSLADKFCRGCGTELQYKEVYANDR